MRHYIPYKAIFVPPFGQVDVTDVLLVIDHPLFQKLRHRTHLGFVSHVYPCATHTRFSHSLAVYEVCKKITSHLLERNMLTQEQAKNSNMAALLHDLGHGPFSHLIEPLMAKSNTRFSNHKIRTRELLDDPSLRQAIEQARCEPSWVQKIAAKEDPLGQIISNNTIGADKMAYTAQDQYFTGYPGRPVDYGAVIPFLMYLEEIYGGEEKNWRLLVAMQSFFFDMYTGVYFRKQVKARERLFEKSLEIAFHEGTLIPDTVWDMTEQELFVQLTKSSNSKIKTILGRMDYSSPHSYKNAITVKLEEYSTTVRVGSKPTNTLALDPEALKQVLGLCQDPLQRTKIEHMLATGLGIPEDDLILTTYPEFGNIIPQDVTLFDSQGRKCGSLFGFYPKHQQALQEKAKDYLCIMVMVSEQHRVQVARMSQKIASLLSTLVSAQYSTA